MSLIIPSLIVVALLSFSANAVKFNTPEGFAVEGLKHISGGNFILSDNINGRLLWYDIRTNQLATIIQPLDKRTFQGSYYDKKNDYLFVSGSGASIANVNNGLLALSKNTFNFSFDETVTPSMHVFKLTTSKLVATCIPEGGDLVNDVVVDSASKFAYFTDSRRPLLYKLYIDNLPECKFDTIPLPLSGFSGTQDTYTAGITKWKGGLILSNYHQGSLWYYDLKSKLSYEIVPQNSGQQVSVRVVAGRCLFSTDYSNNRVNVYRLTHRPDMKKRVSAKLAYRITDPDFSLPSKVDVSGRNLLVSNMNVTILGETGNLYLIKKRLRPFKTLC